MAKIIECIPNFSEGRNRQVIRLLEEEAQAVPGVSLLDVSSDDSHNRTVLTLAGSPEGIAEAAFRLCRTAAVHIDLTKHKGVHPRMGATDVIPFVPIKDVTMEECVALSKAVGERLWEQLQIPVFLYEASAVSEERRNLSNIRKGQFEKMPIKLKEEAWLPDFGGRAVHPTAGVTAVGARAPLIAFNINLHTDDRRIADQIARSIRGSNGGYRYCKALGLLLEKDGKRIAQVSMNMVNYEGTPLYRVFEAVKFEAKRWGVGIAGCEIIGLAPAKALVDCAAYYLGLQDFDFHRHVLENRLSE